MADMIVDWICEYRWRVWLFWLFYIAALVFCGAAPTLGFLLAWWLA